MTMCTSQVAERFDCLAMTLEMPFKDNADLPDADVGWSPARCHNLGAGVLHAIDAVMLGLRDRAGGLGGETARNLPETARNGPGRFRRTSVRPKEARSSTRSLKMDWRKT